MSERRRGAPSSPTLPLFAGLDQPTSIDDNARRASRAAARRPMSANAGDQARLLAIAEVCDRLQCGRTYVYALLQKGILRAVKLGRLTRIPLAELEEFIAHKVADAPYDVCERWSRGGDRAAM